ncbi:hypothetical protein [Aureimonas endophytica]|uniref:hypothetical protein n=1 Tax=Aureimonas endophytica TaxID=2027858 RepID=UPI001AEE763A|nr:hypothetical protein [Aureimonas endophytica]
MRREKKRWEEEEERIKAIVLNQMEDAESYGGEEFIAKVSEQRRKGRLDEKLLKKAGIDVERYRAPDTIIRIIRTEQRVLEGDE